MNQIKATGQPWNPALPTSDCFSITADSDRFGSNVNDQVYLVPPSTSPGVDQIEFLMLPPDNQGQPQCSVFDNNQYTPNQCTTPMGDCTTRCLYDGSMPCLPGSAPHKIGPCLAHPSGWALQGYQCLRTNPAYQCNYTDGTCAESDSGVSDPAVCKAACFKCDIASGNFFIAEDTSGNLGCYRVPWQANRSDDVCPSDSTYGCYAASCNSPGWVASCGSQCSGAYCQDIVYTPQNGYICTSTGYTKCDQPICTNTVVPIDDLPSHPCTVAMKNMKILTPLPYDLGNPPPRAARGTDHWTRPYYGTD